MDWGWGTNIQTTESGKKKKNLFIFSSENKEKKSKFVYIVKRKY